MEDVLAQAGRALRLVVALHDAGDSSVDLDRKAYEQMRAAVDAIAGFLVEPPAPTLLASREVHEMMDGRHICGPPTFHQALDAHAGAVADAVEKSTRPAPRRSAADLPQGGCRDCGRYDAITGHEDCFLPGRNADREDPSRG